MKKIKKILFLLIILIFIYIILCLGLPTKPRTFDYNFFIAFLSLIFMLANEKVKIYKSFILNLFLILTILGQIVLIAITYYFDSTFLCNLSNFMSLLIILEIALYLIKRLFVKQISYDIKILEIKVYFCVKKNTKKFDEQSILKIINEIRKWVTNNSNYNKKNASIIIDLMAKIIECLYKSQISLNDEQSSEYITDEFLKGLNKFYIMIQEDYYLKKKYIKMIVSIIELEIKLGNSELIRKYLNHLCNDIMEFEFCNEDFNPPLASKFIFDFINKKVKGLKEENLNIILDSFEDMELQYQKYDFMIEETKYISFFQGYIKTLNSIYMKLNMVYPIDKLKFIINSIQTRANKNGLDLFEINILVKVIRSNEDLLKQVEIIDNIKRIYKSNFSDNDVMVALCNYLSTLIGQDESADALIIESLFSIAEELPLDSKACIDIKKVFPILIKYDEAKFDAFLKSNKINMCVKKDDFDFFVIALRSVLEMDNVMDVLHILKILIKRTPFDRNAIDSDHLIYVFDNILQMILKKYVTEENALRNYLKEYYDILSDLVDRFEDNISVLKSLIILIADHLENKNTEHYSFNLIKRISFRSIERFDDKAAEIISNKLGWYLFGMISKINNNVDNNLFKCIDHCNKFFKLSCKYLAKETSIFIGTLYVINITYLKMFNDKNSKIANFISINKKIKSTYEFEDTRHILIQSFCIRKESIFDYFQDKNPDDILNACVTSFNELKEKDRSERMDGNS